MTWAQEWAWYFHGGFVFYQCRVRRRWERRHRCIPGEKGIWGRGQEESRVVFHRMGVPILSTVSPVNFTHCQSSYYKSVCVLNIYLSLLVLVSATNCWQGTCSSQNVLGGMMASVSEDTLSISETMLEWGGRNAHVKALLVQCNCRWQGRTLLRATLLKLTVLEGTYVQTFPK